MVYTAPKYRKKSIKVIYLTESCDEMKLEFYDVSDVYILLCYQDGQQYFIFESNSCHIVQ